LLWVYGFLAGWIRGWCSAYCWSLWLARLPGDPLMCLLVSLPMAIENPKNGFSKMKGGEGVFAIERADPERF